MATQFDGVISLPHFEKESFRLGTRIFSTLDPVRKLAVLKLSLTDQSVFCAFDTTVMHPVRGGWGAKGWTEVALQKIPKSMLADALHQAYQEVKSAGANRRK